MVKWHVHGERRVDESPWVNLAPATVEPPGVDAGETPSDGAVREALEEKGWQPTADPTSIIMFHPSNGPSDQTFHIFHCAGAEHVGDPTDPTEASKIEWQPVRDVIDWIRSGDITNGLSLTALTSALTLSVLHVQS
jgi:8-oxo-dGTP pyrophosphatase MutT (NUDIX family)